MKKLTNYFSVHYQIPIGRLNKQGVMERLNAHYVGDLYLLIRDDWIQTRPALRDPKRSVPLSGATSRR